MATLADHPLQATASPMPTMAANYDQDLDSFINFDQLAYTSADAARPKVELAGQPSIPNAEYTGDTRSRSAGFASNAQSPIAFQAPSHHYEEHRQQTGLPPGALSMTYNQVSPMGFGNGAPAYPINGEMMAGHIKRDDAPFNFNTVPARNPSEMDIESDGMNSAPYFLPTNPKKSQYVDPNALGGHELAQAGPSTQVGRMYPGMHQQQAAMAKAAQQQQQDEMVRQQQMQHRAVEDGQNAVPRNGRCTDPVLDERISRLLQHMKQTAAAAGEASPSPSVMPHMAKIKKDEADMDEDERLLASEEGKKLTSKERRQLRNKVSARAFRSRRKEYIGQLESEVAARSNEAQELRMQNHQLFEENARLNDLARMLLGSPHFANFLNDMPDTVSAQIQATQQTQQQPQPQVQPQSQQPAPQPHMQAMPKDATPAHMQQNPQVSMVMVANQGMDASMVNSAGWNTGIEMNYSNTPVFAVFEVPESPVLDMEALSGKTCSPISSFKPSKDEAPAIELPENVSTQQSDIGVANPNVEIDESDPAFALFLDSPVSTLFTDGDNSFDGVRNAKEAPYFELVIDQTSSASAATAKHRFDYLCASIEAAFERVSLLTSHLQ